MISLKEYIELNYPEILEEYIRAKKGKQILKRGIWVRSLQAGFSGPPGVCCQFIKEVNPGDPAGGGSTWGDNLLCFGYIGDNGEEDIRWCVSPDEWHCKVEIMFEEQ